MAGLRPFLLTHRGLAVWLVALALALRIVVPTGYMIGAAHGMPTIELCPAAGPMPIAMPGMHHHPNQPHDKAESPCAFAALATPSLAGADPVLLAVAIAFLVATGFRIAVRPAPGTTPPHLRPPLRGPPGRA